MFDKDPPGKGSGVYTMGILIITMHFIVTDRIFQKIHPKMRESRKIEFDGIMFINN